MDMDHRQKNFMFLDVSINFNHCVFGLNLNVKQASFSFPNAKEKNKDRMPQYLAG